MTLNLLHYLDSTTASTSRNDDNGTRRTIVRGLKMRHLAQVNDPKKLAEIFEALLDAHIPDRRTALYMISINHPGLRKKFTLKARGYTENNGTAIVKQLEMLTQSNEAVKPDDDLSLEFMILENVADDAMTSRGVARSRAVGEAGALVSFIVNNNDGLCLPKAAAVALANGGLNYFRKLYNIKNVRKEQSHLPDFVTMELARRLEFQRDVTTIKKYNTEVEKQRRIEDRDDSQRKAALMLLAHSNIPSDKPGYNLEDLEKIYENQWRLPEHQQDFPLFSFHIFTPNGALIKAFRHPTEHNNQFPLLFIHDEEHLDYAFDLKHLGLQFCRVCKSAHRTHHHRCQGLCSMCQAHVGECEETFPGEQKRCEDCNCLFMNAACLEAHKTTAATSPVEGASLCTRRRYCKDCGRMYHVDSTTPHKCNHHYCDKCECQREEGHKCTWREFREREIQNIKQRTNVFKFGFYDFETMAGEYDKDGNFKPFPNGHVPILARVEIVCNLCEKKKDTENCKNCGPNRKLKFMYEPGQPKSKVVDDFIMHFLGNRRYNDYIMLAHYASGFDIMPIFTHLTSKGILPRIVPSGTRILQMTVDQKSFDFDRARRKATNKAAIKNPVQSRLIFKDTLLFTTCALEAFPKAFGIEEQKGYFPFDMISDEFWDYDKNHYPDFKFWRAAERYKKDKANAIRTWYESVKNNPFNFKEELDRYCRNDVTMLRKGILKFRSAFIEENGFDPFQDCMTAASASQFAFRLNHLKDPTMIAHIDERGYGVRDNQSTMALRYLYWRSQKDDVEIQTALSDKGEARILVANGVSYKVDGLIKSERHIIEVHGCFYHGCQDCNRFITKETVRAEMADRLSRTKMKTQFLRNAGYHVEEVWEHQIKEMLENDKEMKAWFDNWEYIERLFPRSAYFGGRTFTSKMIEICGPLEEIKFFDVNSLYPAMMFKKSYPLGMPKVLKLMRRDFKYDVDPLKYKGLIQCTVVVSPDDRFAVLPYRHNGKLYFSNCRSCCETEQHLCTHKTKEERCFTGIWTHIELREAVKRGAVIGEVVEIWHWDKWSKKGELFGDFVRKFYKTKIANSGWDSSLKTLKMKRKFLRELKRKMGIDLTFSDMKENPTLRQLSKILLNSGYGKFGEKCVRSGHTLTSDRGEIEKMLRDQSIEITNTEWIPGNLDNAGEVDNDSSWLIYHKEVKESKHSVKNGNIVLASYITAYARLEILKHIRKAGNAHIYTDTDSVAFKVREGDGLMDKFKKSINLHLGGLSDEVKEGWKITRWVAPSAKCYAYEMVKRDDPSQKKYVMKIRGVHLTDDNQSGYSFDQFLADVQEYVQDVEKDQNRILELYQQKRTEARRNGEDPDDVLMEKPVPDGKVVHVFKNEQIRRKRRNLVNEMVFKRQKINQHTGSLDTTTGTVYPLGHMSRSECLY